jgi:hypothetical protein
MRVMAAAWPVWICQTRIVPSLWQLANHVRSAVIATARTRPVWPVRWARWVPVAASQIRTAPLVSLPAATRLTRPARRDHPCRPPGRL